MAATHVQPRQKALDPMNLQLHHVISDVTGTTGLAILEAILKGERDPQVLAQLRDRRIKASAETIAKSLVGDYRPEHLFVLCQSLTSYRAYSGLNSGVRQGNPERLGPFPDPGRPRFDAGAYPEGAQTSA